jgi:hypothetical protein
MQVHSRELHNRRQFPLTFLPKIVPAEVRESFWVIDATGHGKPGLVDLVSVRKRYLS